MQSQIIRKLRILGTVIPAVGLVYYFVEQRFLWPNLIFFFPI